MKFLLSANSMKDRKTLVIVDMQPYFEASNCKRTQDEIIRLIDEAKKNDDYIIILEYALDEEWGDRTHDSIINAIGMYDKCFTGLKEDDDGSDVVDDIVTSHCLKTNDMIVCGVNAHACVKSTALGLSNRYQSVTVVGKACNDPYKDPFRWATAWKRPNLHLIED